MTTALSTPQRVYRATVRALEAAKTSYRDTAPSKAEPAVCSSTPALTTLRSRYRQELLADTSALQRARDTYLEL
jgi:hypothetical protein